MVNETLREMAVEVRGVSMEHQPPSYAEMVAEVSDEH